MVDRSAIGHSFPPVTAYVERRRRRFFRKALEQSGEAGGNAPPEGLAKAPIPPTYLFCLEMMDSDDPFDFLTKLDIDIGRLLHGEQRFTYHRPVFVGEALTFRTNVTDIADKKGGALTFVTLTPRVENGEGVHVADTERLLVVRT